MKARHTDVIDSFASQEHAVAVLLRNRPATYWLLSENPRFADVMRVLADSWRTRRPVLLEIEDDSIILSAEESR